MHWINANWTKNWCESVCAKCDQLAKVEWMTANGRVPYWTWPFELDHFIPKYIKLEKKNISFSNRSLGTNGQRANFLKTFESSENIYDVDSANVCVCVWSTFIYEYPINLNHNSFQTKTTKYYNTLQQPQPHQKQIQQTMTKNKFNIQYID